MWQETTGAGVVTVPEPSVAAPRKHSGRARTLAFSTAVTFGCTRASTTAPGRRVRSIRIPPTTRFPNRTWRGKIRRCYCVQISIKLCCCECDCYHRINSASISYDL
uniref:(northern house mosquito) hypothetical protein n=1 Tax=Culex pipiens TaxID=7175 RepID=A0A8D8A7H3_CULPI